jgi:acyl carrier protein
MQSNATVPFALITREEVLSGLQDLLKTILNLETTASLRPEARFIEDLHSDSLAMVDIVIGVEEAFGIKLRSDLNFFEEVRTIGNAVDLIHRQLGHVGAVNRSTGALT